MTTIFDNLNETQYQHLKDALPLITILIAGADDNIDEQELNWAEKLTYIRTYADPEELNSFYAEIEDVFTEKVSALIESLPKELNARQEEISSRLSIVNNVLPLLENKIAFQIYESLTSFAEHIAKASGGFLRFGSVSSEEKKWLELPMINPVIREDLDGEEED
jgi:hypothetical protein